MAIGESSYFSSGSDNNATRKTTPEYSYYSRYSFLSADKKVSLRFEYGSGLLKCKLFTRPSEDGQWNTDPTEIVYLSATKCMILDNQIDKFKEYINSGNIDPNVAFGVNGGMNDKVAFIAFHTNDAKELLITIGKFDGNGTIVEKCTYNSSANFNYGLDWKKLDDMDVEKAFYNNIELDMIHQMVKDFARGMSGAIGYGVHDTGRYDTARILNKLDPIYDKLGIERYTPSTNRSRGTNNFLNSMNGGNNNHGNSMSIDDLMG